MSQPYAGELALPTRLTSLSELGRDEAASNRPPTTALQLDRNEVAVVTDGQGFVAQAHQALMSVLTDSSRKAHELEQGIPELETRIRQTLSEPSVRNDALAELARDKAQLVGLAETRMRAHTDFKYFRELHHIKEEPSYPESYTWYWAILLSLWFGEAVANAAFYENAAGLLGGWFVALAVSAVNIGTALVLGMLFRFHNLRLPWYKRYGGWLCLPSFASISVYCNALFAAFRSEYQALVDPTDSSALRDAFRQAADQAREVFTGQFELGDFMSFILFAFGILLSFFAFYKGMNFDDKYPGQGKLHRKYRQDRASEEGEYERVRGRLRSFLDMKREALVSLGRQVSGVIRDTGVHAAHLQRTWAAYRTQEDLICQDCTRALQTYRYANAAVRPTPAPPYFAEYPDIRRVIDEKMAADILNRLGAARREAQGLLEKYQSDLNVKANSLQSEIAYLLDRGFADFLTDVERQAQNRINRMTGTVQAASSETAIDAQRA
jgi:hypothetical protein